MENSTDAIYFKAQKNYALDGKIMLCSVTILFVAVVLILSFHGYAGWLFDRCRRHRRYATHPLLLSAAAPNSSSGLDVAVINSIPTFAYSADEHHQPLECAVCISEFENGEMLCVLPKCNHTFHVDCIVVWFHSHSTCPLCRAPIRCVIRVDLSEKSTSEETGTSAAELTDSGGENEVNACSPGMKALDLQLMGIVVEVPGVANGSDRVEDVGEGSASRE